MIRGLLIFEGAIHSPFVLAGLNSSPFVMGLFTPSEGDLHFSYAVLEIYSYGDKGQPLFFGFCPQLENFPFVEEEFASYGSVF